MSDTDESYCRLCAEPTPKEQLISSDEDVAITSKIITKMLWINIDISDSNTLPTTICFSCFDLLERTWSFLHNVRVAQEKLREIFELKLPEQNGENSSDVKKETVYNEGKPLDTDWDDFSNPKANIKLDPGSEIIAAVDPDTLEVIVKNERNSIDCDNNENDSLDSDTPLQCTVTKRKAKKKKKLKFKQDLLSEEFIKTEIDNDSLGLNSINTTWEDYMCRCANCDALCKNVASLRLHALQIHYRCCTFKCTECGKVLLNYRNFVNHVRTHNNVLKRCCEYCNKRFSLSTYFKKHLNNIHNNVCLTTCHYCGSHFETEELLQDHLVIYARGLKKSRKAEKLELDLKCEDCGKEFKSRSNLQQHKLVHTERSRDFSCHMCGKMFFTKGTLSTHMGTHEDTKPFKCEFCPMAFRARGNLQSHISLHSGSKPFVCEQCGKSFRVKRHLKSHSIVHTDLMPYVCVFCNKSFRFKTRLNLHLRQHTGAKPYRCIYCQRDFTNGSNYKKHMKRRHNIDTSKKRYVNVVDSVDSNDLTNEATVESA